MEKKNHDKTSKATNKDKPKTKSKPKIFKYLTIFFFFFKQHKMIQERTF